MPIRDPYDKYNDVLKPLIALVEARLERFPIGLLNELRSVHDHIARTYLPGTSPESVEEEIESANRHVRRSILDCYKILCHHGETVLQAFGENYRGVRLAEVDSGRFLPRLTALSADARDLVQRAKLNGRPTDQTIQAYDRAFLAYGELHDFIRTSAQVLEWAGAHQRRQVWCHELLAAIIGLVVGCLSIWIMAGLFGLGV